MKYLLLLLVLTFCTAAPALAGFQPGEEYHRTLCNDAFNLDNNLDIITFCSESVTDSVADTYTDVGDEKALDFALCGINEIRIAIAEGRLGDDSTAAASYQLAQAAYETARSLTGNPRILSSINRGEALIP